MNRSLLFNRKKSRVKDLENFYNRFLLNFTSQLGSLNVDEMYNKGLDRFNAVISDAEKQFRKERKKLMRKSWYKEMKKGIYFPKRIKLARTYLGKNVPLFLNWADMQFSRAENFAAGNAVKAQSWVKMNYEKLRDYSDDRGKWLRKNYPKVEMLMADKLMKAKDSVIRGAYQVKKMAS